MLAEARTGLPRRFRGTLENVVEFQASMDRTITDGNVSAPSAGEPPHGVPPPTNAGEPASPPEPADIIGGRALLDLDEPPLVVWAKGVEGAGATRLVSIGEPCILAGPGGSGKSYVALNVALAAVSESRPTHACGLRLVYSGDVLLVSYDDGPRRIAARLRHLQCAQESEVRSSGLSVVCDPAPLWAPADGSAGAPAPTAAFQRLRQRIEADSPSLIIIDPLDAAAAGINLNDWSATAACVRSLAALSAEIGAGVLLVASATKAARGGARDAVALGPGAVSGSAQWTDGAGAVLYLHPPAAWAGERLLECVKAKHGPAGWGVRLREVDGPAGLFGGFVADGGLVGPEDVAAWQAAAVASKNTRQHRR